MNRQHAQDFRKLCCFRICLCLVLSGFSLSVSQLQGQTSEVDAWSYREVNAESAHFPMLSGKDSLEKIEVMPGFQVQLVASEPLVKDPVSFDWGPDGKLWVVEMADYPFQNPKAKKPGGRIKVLTDLNNDGIYDRSVLFADGLSTPNGIMPWRDGVLVSACPDILFLADRNGDGRADHVEKLFSGFNEGNQQHRVNGFAWGIDNWIYLANGDSGGTVLSHKTGEQIDIRGRDLRINVDTGEMELQPGQTQFGRQRDDWGNWFGSNNPNPIFHFVYDEQYLKRNPLVAAPASKRDIRTGPATVFPIGPMVSHCDPKYRPIGSTPVFTSACSTIIYRDDLFGADFSDVTFTCEPVYNLVHTRKLKANGVSFRSSKHLADEQEFFRSADPWSRPTCCRVGPDGAIYIADMVREVIEHPEWIADDLEADLDLWSGAQFGRIYRVSPVQQLEHQTAIPDSRNRINKGLTSTKELVSLLDSSSGWQRDMVQRSLLWRSDMSCVSELEKQLSHSERPTTRLHALATLHGLKKLTPESLLTSLQDEHPMVRRHAIYLAEDWAQDAASHPQISNALQKLANDENDLVRLQLLFSLGEFKTAWSNQLLSNISEQVDLNDDFQAAFLSSIQASNMEPILSQLLESASEKTQLIAQLIAISVRDQSIELNRSTLASLLTHPQRLVIAADLLQALKHSDRLDNRTNSPQVWQSLEVISREAEEIAFARGYSLEQKKIALRIVGLTNERHAQVKEQLLGLIRPEFSNEIQTAALRRLSELAQADFVTSIHTKWRELAPSIRQEFLAMVFESRTKTRQFLVLVEQNGEIAKHLTAAQRTSLREHPSEDIRSQATQLLRPIESDRQLVINQYASAITKAHDGGANSERGKSLFEKSCATCHQLAGIGTPVGPDLNRLRDRSPSSLLRAIIDPNMAVESKFLQYNVMTLDGRTLSGIITNEDANKVVLTTATGRSIPLLREDIEQLIASEDSLMPEGIEKDLSIDQMADLLQFLVDATHQ